LPFLDPFFAFLLAFLDHGLDGLLGAFLLVEFISQFDELVLDLLDNSAEVSSRAVEFSFLHCHVLLALGQREQFHLGLFLLHHKFVLQDEVFNSFFLLDEFFEFSAHEYNVVLHFLALTAVSAYNFIHGHNPSTFFAELSVGAKNVGADGSEARRPNSPLANSG